MESLRGNSTFGGFSRGLKTQRDLSPRSLSCGARNPAAGASAAPREKIWLHAEQLAPYFQLKRRFERILMGAERIFVFTCGVNFWNRRETLREVSDF